MTNTPKDAAEIASRLHRLTGLNQTQIDSLSLSLDPIQVDQINDSDLASLVNGTLPGLPLNASGGLPLGLPGATSAARFVGGTASGAPTSGTFAVRDWVVTGTGTFYVCTVAGSPGTWVQVSGGGASLPSQTGNSGKVLGTDGTSASWVTGSAPLNYFDPSAYTSTGIQAAIDAAATAGGGVVELRQNATINTTLRMKTGVWLRGLGVRTVLSGTASPMIALPASGAVVDRITVTDLFLQSPAGAGIKFDASPLTGGYQLGWPRIVIQRVTAADAAGNAFELVGSAAIEARLVDCVSLRAVGIGFAIGSTDNVLVGCTAGQGSSHGFYIQGGNNRLTACKGYGNTGDGFWVAGAGRHNLAGCEAQDNTLDGFEVSGSWNVITALADSNGRSGFDIYGSSNTVNGSAMYGGGGSGQVTPVGFWLTTGTGNVVSGVSNCTAPVTAVAGNWVQVNAVDSGRLARTAVKTGAYTAKPGELVPVDTTSAAVTITLPAAPLDRTQIGVKHAIQGGANAVTIARGGSDVFNKASGSTSLTLSTVNQTMVLQYDSATSIWDVRDSPSLGALDARFDAAGAAAAVLPTQTSNSGKYLTTNGTVASWGTVAGGVSSVNSQTGAVVLTLPAQVRSVSVAYAATVTPNADTTDILSIGALTGNITLANPTGSPVDGQKLTIRMAQDGTGSRTVSYGTGYAFGSDVTSALDASGASSKWERVFEWNTADSKWRAVGIVRGF